MASAKLPGQIKTQLALPWFITVPIKRFFSAENFRIFSLAGTLSIVTMTSHLGCDVIVRSTHARFKYGGVREDPTAVFTEFLTSLALESTAASFRICRTKRTGNGRLKQCSDLVVEGWGVHYLERHLALAVCYSLRKWFTYFSMPSFFQNMPFQTKNKVRLFFVMMGGASFAFSLPFIMTWFQIKKKSS